MKYVVIVEFTDLQDNRMKYRVGDEFPRSGLKVSAERLNELATDKNRRGFAVIEAVKVEEKAHKPEVEVIEAETVEAVPETIEAKDEAVFIEQEEPKPVKTAKGKKKNDNK